jgi:hypothetical protein
MQNVNVVDALLRSCPSPTQLAVTIGRLAETEVRERLPLVSCRPKDSWSPCQDSAQLESETMS